MGKSSTVVLVVFLAACAGAGKKAVDAAGPGEDGSAQETTATPDGSGLADVAPALDCQPYPPGAGGCNECFCTESGWQCTLIECDTGSGSDAAPADVWLPGDDVQNKGECCDSDDECTSAMACIGGTGEGGLGVCQPKPNKIRCYEDATCPAFHKCVGAHICTCDMNCMTEEGKCTPIEAGCCTVDGDCPEGTHCVGEDLGDGVCLSDPIYPNRCWEDEECDVGETCVDSFWCGCDADCDLFHFGYCQDAAFQECVETYSGCECYEGCADGFWNIVFYPEEFGEFPSDINPPAELLDVGIAMYECGVCSCHEAWHVKKDGAWINSDVSDGVNVEEFCKHLLGYDEECGGCLASWEGGCC
jgi:hypothetical protein